MKSSRSIGWRCSAANSAWSLTLTVGRSATTLSRPADERRPVGAGLRDDVDRAVGRRHPDGVEPVERHREVRLEHAVGDVGRDDGGLGLLTGVADGDGRPHGQALLRARSASRRAADVASRSASEPVATSGSATAVMAAGSTAVAKSRSPSTWSSAPRTWATCGDAGHLLDVARHGARERLAHGVGHDVVGDDVLGQGLVEAGLGRGPEHRHHRHAARRRSSGPRRWPRCGEGCAGCSARPSGRPRRTRGGRASRAPPAPAGRAPG